MKAVATYVVGLATVATGSTAPLDVRLREPDLRFGVDVVKGQTQVALGSVPDRAAVIEGQAQAVIDRATGRSGGPVRGDERGLAVLDGFGTLLAG